MTLIADCIPMPFRHHAVVASTLIVLALAQPAATTEIDHAKQYRDCIALSKIAPNEAFGSALAWRDLGGGEAAEHCVAASLVALEQFAEAATRLEALAQRTRRAASIKAGLLGHAAQAWLLDGKPERAETVLTTALRLTPDQPDLLVDRAQARADRNDYASAIEDLNRAIDIHGGSADAFAFRATAQRHLEQTEAALRDVGYALALDLLHPEALLERGNLRRIKGDERGARKDWMMVLSVAPNTPAADAARANLEDMDVNKQ